MRTTKPLVEMTTQELREEIGRLTTTLNRVHDKNRRRKRALKDINKSVLIHHKTHMDNYNIKRLMRDKIEMLQKQNELYRSMLDKERETHKKLLHDAMHGKIKVTGGYEMNETGEVSNAWGTSKPGFFSRLLGRKVRGVTGA